MTTPADDERDDEPSDVEKLAKKLGDAELASKLLAWDGRDDESDGPPISRALAELLARHRRS